MGCQRRVFIDRKVLDEMPRTSAETTRVEILD